METSIPKISVVLKTLLRSDFVTQWRNRRAVILTLIVPVIILTTWKPFVAPFGGPFVLSNSITIGLVAIGLMGYATAIARDRDKGVFQRLRVAPISAWSIMVSRLIVQMAMILMVTTAVFIAGSLYDEVTLTPAGYVVTYLTAMMGGALYLSIGQMVVGRINNAETVNSTVRLIYFVFIMVGMFGQFSTNEHLHKIVHWSPYGTVKTILAVGMEPEKWNYDASMALLVTLGYSLVCAVLGIKWFKWNTK
jgi:ABC-2 type transport system permease protein